MMDSTLPSQQSSPLIYLCTAILSAHFIFASSKSRAVYMNWYFLNIKFMNNILPMQPQVAKE